jgi:hypothetical protein
MGFELDSENASSKRGFSQQKNILPGDCARGPVNSFRHRLGFAFFNVVSWG